ncbi:MAG: acyl carrier protein [Chloroflexota bacterium]
MNEYQQRILDYIESEYLLDDSSESLTIETSLIDQGIIDSMGIFRLVEFLTETFEIEIAPSDILLRNFKNIHTIAELVTQKRHANAPIG